MHVSLDSALGRQRRLNSVGESVLQIAPSAAAAYSLRSLTGGDPKVVRVRRASDNHEQDFTASGVSSGALTSFVNAQVVAPLDIQELSGTGRDGDFIIAKAAYSLRSLGTRQATVAATGDTVARADGKYVCQVRRASDDTIKSFTADEVTDGTLLAFVVPTDVQALYGSARYFNGTSTAVSVFDSETVPAAFQGLSDAIEIEATIVAGAVSGSGFHWFSEHTIAELREEGAAGTHVPFSLGVNNSKLTLGVSDNYTTGAEKVVSTTTLVVGQEYVVKVVISGDNYEFFLDGVSDGSGTFSTATGDRSVGASTSNLTIGVRSKDSGAYDSELFQGVIRSLTINNGTSDILSYTGLGNSSTAWQDTIGSNDGTETNGVTFTGQGFDGFVKTWYDQSVTNQAGDTATGNHAVQATAASQPKIVDAGSLLNELDFDGTDDALDIDFGADLSQANTLFMVHQSDSNSSSANEFFDITTFSSGADRTLLDQSGSNYRMLGASSADTGVAVTTDKSLIFALYNGASSLFAKNGTATSALNAGTSGINQNSSLGVSSSGTRFYDGSMQEFIIYNSDQSSNRVAVETNINSHYSIF